MNQLQLSDLEVAVSITTSAVPDLVTQLRSREGVSFTVSPCAEGFRNKQQNMVTEVRTRVGVAGLQKALLAGQVVWLPKAAPGRAGGVAPQGYPCRGCVQALSSGEDAGPCAGITVLATYLTIGCLQCTCRSCGPLHVLGIDG